MRKTILFIALWLFAVSSHAATPAPTSTSSYTAFGSTDCGEWIAKPSSTQKEWVLGMLTGINYQHQVERLWPVDPLSKLGSAYQAFLWVDNYCKAHPLDTVGNAVVDLFDALWKK